MQQIELATLAAKAHGMDHFVRLPATDYASVMRPLEAGAGGVMISMVRSAAEAEQAVRWAKFWPRGERGLNGGNRDGRFGLTPLAEYMAAANASTFVGIQIETAGALSSAAEIAAIPDVDLLFVGPSDLSQVLGVPGDFENPKCLEAIERIARTCAEARKPWGVFTSRDPGYAERMRALGCRLFVVASDTASFHAGIRAAKDRYKSFFQAR
jgi:2-dehydro-3-deoxyglucarate aldolase/4-hydroxy-2-oxoheptanedioate aldolase